MLALCAAVGLMAMSASANTTSLSFVSTTIVNGNDTFGSLGKYNGSMTWNYTSGLSGTLTVQVNVLAGTALGGKLTGIAFGAPGAVGSLAYSLTSSPSNAYNLFTNFNVAPPGPFGNYAAGAGTNPTSWEGGDPSSAGALGVGQSGTWVFTVGGTEGALAALTAASFFNSADPFVARFQGFANGDSDKSPAMESVVVVPVPAPVLLAGLGLIGVAAARRRFSSR